MARLLRGDLLTSPYFWAIAVRLTLLVFFPYAARGDAYDFEVLATNIAGERGWSRCLTEPFLPSALRPPLYPLILGILYWLGLDHRYGPGLLNLCFDLVSMMLLRTWARDLGFRWAAKSLWLVALCPLLLGLSLYPLTENLSVMLFLAATVLTFRKRVWGGGLAWGALALCRSYYLLFPIVLFLFRPSSRWSRRTLAGIAAVSMLLPGAWVVRNVISVGRVSFSQSAGAGFQAYSGMCFTGFDWWDRSQVAEVRRIPEVLSLLEANAECVPDSEVARRDGEVMGLLRQCVADRPWTVAGNVLYKQVRLLTHWGQIFPYTEIPKAVSWPIDAAMAGVWAWLAWVMVQALRRGGKGRAAWREAAAFSVVNVLYVLAVTLPFLSDSRYLLAPFLVLALVGLEASGSGREKS